MASKAVPAKLDVPLPSFTPPRDLRTARAMLWDAALTMHEQAYIAGKVLIHIKTAKDENGLRLVDHGDFLPWLEANFPMSQQTASRVMRFAKQCDEAGRLLDYHPAKLLTVSNIVPEECDPVPEIQLQDALEWLPNQPHCKLLVTDPPYSTEIDNIQAFAECWLPLALDRLLPDGRAYVCVGSYPSEMRAYLAVAQPTQLLVWTYENTLGRKPKHDYVLNQQAILYYRGPDAPPLDCPELIEQFSVQDIPAPDARQHERYHKWQKPLELGLRFVRHATRTGDLVLDPFAGTGTFLLAAGKLGRRGLGCDVDQDVLEIARQRGCRIV